MTVTWMIWAFSVALSLQILQVKCLDCPTCDVLSGCKQNVTHKKCTSSEVCELSLHGTNIAGKCSIPKYCISSARNTCCHDDSCVRFTVQQINYDQSDHGHNNGNHGHVTHPTHHVTHTAHTTHGLSTPETSVLAETTTPHTVGHRVCIEEVKSDAENCTSMRQYGLCSDHIGVRICPRTCGFCEYLADTFGNKPFCEDKLVGGECAYLNKSQNICAESISVYTCPKTCGLCDAFYEVKITDFLKKAVVQTSKTTVAVTTTTSKPCVDTFQDGCSSLINICSDKLAEKVCPRFCNLCDAPLTG